MKLKRLLIPFLLLLILLVSCKKQETDITVFSNGKTDYSIIIDKNASTSVSSFASDLSKDFSASCEIYDDESKKFDREIIIGHTNRAITAEYILELDTVTMDYGFGYLIAEKETEIERRNEGKHITDGNDNLGISSNSMEIIELPRETGECP